MTTTVLIANLGTNHDKVLQYKVHNRHATDVPKCLKSNENSTEVIWDGCQILISEAPYVEAAGQG